MAKVCDRCGADNPEIAQFCARCGRSFDEPLARLATPLSRFIQQWRRLSRTLTRKEVRTLLGEPRRIDAPAATGAEAVETWVYEYEAVGGPDERVVGSVSISLAESRAVAWSEPNWERIRG